MPTNQTPLLTAQTNESYMTDLSAEGNAGGYNTAFDTTAPSFDYADILDGYDTRGLMNEFGEYFDPYDLSQEAFAQRNLALQEDDVNARVQQQQRNFGMQQTQGRSNLTNLYETQQEGQGGGFAGSGRRDRQVQRAIDAQSGNFENQLFNLRGMEQTAQRDLDRAGLGFEQDVFGMRQKFGSDTRDTLLDLLKTGADLKPFEEGTAEYKARMGNLTNLDSIIPGNERPLYLNEDFDAEAAFDDTMTNMDDAFGEGNLGATPGITGTPTELPEAPWNLGGGVEGDHDALNPKQTPLSTSAQGYFANSPGRAGWRENTISGQNFMNKYRGGGG
mgnify:CR=1 FL=1